MVLWTKLYKTFFSDNTNSLPYHTTHRIHSTPNNSYTSPLTPISLPHMASSSLTRAHATLDIYSSWDDRNIVNLYDGRPDTNHEVEPQLLDCRRCRELPRIDRKELPYGCLSSITSIEGGASRHDAHEAILWLTGTKVRTVGNVIVLADCQAGNVLGQIRYSEKVRGHLVLVVLKRGWGIVAG